MNEVIAFIDSHRQRFVDELIDWVRIPSVSSDPARAPDVLASAEHLAARLRELRADRVAVWPTSGHPAVFAEWLCAPGGATLLVYGHHDVQPVDPLGEWISPPFEPDVRSGRLWGRGTVDDKGQVYIHAKAIESFIRTKGCPPINVKMIVEGEEEVGSAHLDGLLREHARDLRADFVCVSDTAMFGRGIPSLCVGLRGLSYLEVFVDGPSSDLHSGSFGGGIANPVNALARMIAQLHDAEGHVAVPGFYDDVVPLSAGERDAIAHLPFDEAEWLASTGAPGVWGERGYSTLERIWARPTLDCCGIGGGFQGEGAKTIIPARAQAKISCRLVPNQEPDDIARKVTEHLRRIAPVGTRVRVQVLHGGRPYLAPTDHPIYDVAKRAFSKAFGRPTVFIREGGSIPFVRTIADASGKPCLLMGFGQPDENAHAPNEWLDLENYHLGIKSAAYLYDEIARMNHGSEGSGVDHRRAGPPAESD
ncbi:MAG: dipeptidase [Polyangiaceae bacterium]|jgi:acetylornithine deacetylase/succinyl-diaminopimelate desuccinylase-like protein